jgi:hypothetical protein
MIGYDGVSHWWRPQVPARSCCITFNVSTGTAAGPVDTTVGVADTYSYNEWVWYDTRWLWVDDRSLCGVCVALYR